MSSDSATPLALSYIRYFCSFGWMTCGLGLFGHFVTGISGRQRMTVPVLITWIAVSAFLGLVALVIVSHTPFSVYRFLSFGRLNFGTDTPAFFAWKVLFFVNQIIPCLECANCIVFLWLSLCSCPCIILTEVDVHCCSTCTLETFQCVLSVSVSSYGILLIPWLCGAQV